MLAATDGVTIAAIILGVLLALALLMFILGRR